MRALATGLGTDLDDPWAPAARRLPRRRRCVRRTAERLHRTTRSRLRWSRPTIPADLDRTPTGRGATPSRPSGGSCSTSRAPRPEAARRVVTVSPDVASSTNLGGWLNKVGSWSARERHRLVRRRRRDDPALARAARPDSTSSSGIAETNLVGLLGELGATWSRWGEPLLPDRRALRPLRRPRPRALGVRHVRRRAVDPGRHAVRGVAGARGGRPPVDHHAVDRPRAAGLRRPSSPPSPSRSPGACWTGSSRLGREPGGSSTYLRLSTAPGRSVPRHGPHRPRRARPPPPPGRRPARIPLRRSAGRPCGHHRRHGRRRPPGARGRRTPRREPASPPTSSW